MMIETWAKRVTTRKQTNRPGEQKSDMITAILEFFVFLFCTRFGESVLWFGTSRCCNWTCPCSAVYASRSHEVSPRSFKRSIRCRRISDQRRPIGFFLTDTRQSASRRRWVEKWKRISWIGRRWCLMFLNCLQIIVNDAPTRWTVSNRLLMAGQTMPLAKVEPTIDQIRREVQDTVQNILLGITQKRKI